MELPNYFLADLPGEAHLTHGLVSDACATLQRNRATYLSARDTASIIKVLSSLARDWRNPEFPFRQEVLAQGPAQTGFTAATLASGLDNFWEQITRENLERLILQDLGHLDRLDEMSAGEVELKQDRASFARGSDLLVHITGGVLPNPTLMSMILGLLTRSAQFLKCARGTAFLPRMFAHSLYQIEPKLGACLEIAEWKGGNELLESALFAAASCVTATGSDETLAAIQKRLPPSVRFLGYGHKVSFGIVTREMLSRAEVEGATQAVADDITAWNQLGCLSPHSIYVETGGPLAPPQFAELLAKELDERERIIPRGEISVDAAAAIATRRMFYQVRASAGDDTKSWASEGSTAWTVVYEENPQFQLSCLNRFVYVKPVGSIGELLQAAAPVQKRVSTVGLSAPARRAAAIAKELADWGVLRVCRAGQMQNPTLTWRHDGRPSLGDLITWTDFEL